MKIQPGPHGSDPDRIKAPFEAVILDLDGVITKTADLHARAWKQMFDSFLESREERPDERHEPFDPETDYRRYVDGKPRYEGVGSFLDSRGIELPWGSQDDDPDRDTVCGLGNRKNDMFRDLLDDEGVKTYADTVDALERWRDQGLATAMITSSRNGRYIVQRAGLTDAFDVQIDGNDAAELDIDGKPAPDVFLEAARRLGVEPGRAVVIEDAQAGVQAGAAGGFGLVVGVNRGQGSDLKEHGADIVVDDLRTLHLGIGSHPGVETSHGKDGREAGRDSARRFEPWKLIYTEWNPADQALREALCALGNGHIVTRAAVEEASADDVHYPGTYLAGGYNRLESEVSGRVIENEDLVNWPNWLPLTYRHVGGTWLDINAVELLDFHFELDVRAGLLTRRMRFRDQDGRKTELQSRRFVHMTRPHLAGIEWTIKPLNWSGEIEIRSGLDGRVVNDNVERYRGLENRHLDVVASDWESDDAFVLTARTNQSKIRMTQAARTRVFEGEQPAAVQRERDRSEGWIGQRIHVTCHEKKDLRVEKIVSIRTSVDDAISETEVNARKDIARAGTFAQLLETHATKWHHLWSISDLELENGDVESQMILRLHLFHLLQTVSTNTIARDVGVPARGWHGEAYRGHIFWDELFIFPTIILRIPEIGRSLLLYRYRRLQEARYNARSAGYEGAMFPWQSGSDGSEESQDLHLNPESGNWLPDTTHRQRHVNAAIAYNVWSYYQATGDSHFLAYYGAEVILEIARFFASLATFDADKDRYVIEGVVGPDEFHTDDPNADEPGLKNNAYTNVFAAWVLRCACGVLDRLDEERRGKLRHEIRLDDGEIARWEDIGRRLFVPFHDDGMISQFEGYEQLEELDWGAYRAHHGDTLRLDRILEAEGDDVNRYKASKQADVLMLMYLFTDQQLDDLFEHLGYEYDERIAEKNIAYYLERTAHGSTLSQMVYAWILSRRDRKRAWTLWQQALHSDLDDIQGGTTPEGIHLGAMAGTVDLVHRGHAGIVMDKDVLWFDPELPVELSTVNMRIRYRNQWLTAEITHDALTISCDRGPHPEITIGFRGEAQQIGQGETCTFHL